MNILFIDNFDSFTYNLVDEFAKREAQVSVYRNDIALTELDRIVGDTEPALLIISPGPSTPARAGVCLEAVKSFAGRLPIFGVCLGHQVIIEAFGGRVDRAPLPMHGKTSWVDHDGKGIFTGLPQPMAVGRYHSLVGVEIPDVLEVSARTDEIVMGLRHKELPVAGVQFHPESILTPTGGLMVENLMGWAAGLAENQG